MDFSKVHYFFKNGDTLIQESKTTYLQLLPCLLISKIRWAQSFQVFSNPHSLTFTYHISKKCAPHQASKRSLVVLGFIQIWYSPPWQTGWSYSKKADLWSLGLCRGTQLAENSSEFEDNVGPIEDFKTSKGEAPQLRWSLNVPLWW